MHFYQHKKTTTSSSVPRFVCQLFIEVDSQVRFRCVVPSWVADINPQLVYRQVQVYSSFEWCRYISIHVVVIPTATLLIKPLNFLTQPVEFFFQMVEFQCFMVWHVRWLNPTFSWARLNSISGFNSFSFTMSGSWRTFISGCETAQTFGSYAGQNAKNWHNGLCWNGHRKQICMYIYIYIQRHFYICVWYWSRSRWVCLKKGEVYHPEWQHTDTLFSFVT